MAFNPFTAVLNPIIGAATSVLNPVVGGIDKVFSADTSAQDAQVQDAISKIQQMYGNLQMPDLNAPEFQTYQNLSNYAPQVDYRIDPLAQAQAAQLSPSLLASIKADPRLADQQMASLEALNNISKNGGLTPQDLANLNKVQSDVAQADRGRREAILQNMNARGLGGSGQELLAQLQSAQAATDRASQQGMDINALAADRAFNALMQSGNLASSLRNQQFDEQAKQAAAQDAINQFNASNLNQFALSNANAQNQYNQNRANQQMAAQQYNNASRMNALQQNQDIANKNVDLRNQALSAQAAIPQQQFQNQLDRMQGMSGGYKDLINYNQQKASEEQQKRSGYLDAIIKGGSAVATSGR